MRLASRFVYANQIRRDRPMTHEELMHYVPGIFGEGRLSALLRLPDTCARPGPPGIHKTHAAPAP